MEQIFIGCQEEFHGNGKGSGDSGLGKDKKTATAFLTGSISCRRGTITDGGIPRKTFILFFVQFPELLLF